jgi:oligoendopeptidase F
MRAFKRHKKGFLGMSSATLRPRSEVADQYKWDAESVFADRAAWAAEGDALRAALPQLTTFDGQLGTPDTLASFLKLQEDLGVRVQRFYFYAVMSQRVDTGDMEATSMVGNAGSLYGQFMAARSFAEPQILAIGQARLLGFADHVPALAIYKHYFTDLFRRQAYVRSAEVEEVLGLVAEVFQSADSAYDMLTDADMQFPDVKVAGGEPLKVAQSTVGTLAGHPDREVRRQAWENYCDEYLAHKNTVAATLITAVKRDVFTVRARRYGSSLDAALFDNNIPTAVFHTLIDTYKKHLPTWHRYWAVRRRALGVEKLHHYDIWAPISTTPPVVSYEQSVDWICAALQPLGDEYVNALRRGCTQDRWVDVYPTAGKGAGAFSFGAPGLRPFIMMSYNDSFDGMSTLAHELGHSMHSYLTWQHQPLIYADYSLFVAEVASNFNQAMTRAYLFEQVPDRDFQIALIEEAMDNFHRYFFIMPTLARFELEVHQRIERGEGVTADDLNALMADLFAEGYGGELEIDREREGITWAQFGHLYSNFYVFQYATGISAAHALAEPILKGDKTAAKRYVEFLSSGSSRYALDVLRHAGVDMTTPKAIESAFAVLGSLVDRLDRLTS